MNNLTLKTIKNENERLRKHLSDVIKNIELPIELDNIQEKIIIGASFGLAEAYTDSSTAEELLSFADKAMYKNKPNGR